ncbi:amino acid adenylation domain-containing protein [Microcoleus sp. Pol11C3]|uniref:amino acid adenylation domain-containing protein n=1 Tax=Microcoleus sp. Pol11C3 TaxID=3055390 RepID=UPI002FD2A1D3
MVAPFNKSEIPIFKPEQQLRSEESLTDAERHKILVEWNNTQSDYPIDKCIHQLFEEQVERTPDAVAIVFEGEQLSYLELNARANQLAHYLQKRGVGPEVLVGICVERSFEMIVGLLGILKAGGAYVPLDPAYPQERLAFMLEDSSVSVLLAQSKLVEKLPPHSACVVCLDSDWEEIAFHSQEKPSSSLTPDNLVYVIYTSGSTGKPKGVLLAHRGLCNLATSSIQLFDVQPSSRLLQFASFSFDASVWEVFIALVSGATLILAKRDFLMPGSALAGLLRDEAITTVILPPSVLAVLPAEEFPTLLTIIVGGEACSANLVARWASGRHFFNAYGPTEATVCATVALCTDGSQKPPIGRPIANTKIYILDTQNQPVPIGEPGELHIGGVGLARGYLKRPDLTEQKFIPNPFSDKSASRLYKTGDLARYLPDGNIEFLGRIDNQVKIRGFRIELGEIEAVLSAHPIVDAVAVIDREDIPNEERLVAYIVPKKDEINQVSAKSMRNYLADHLPDYMIPSAFITLPVLPITPNGKIDRRALPAPSRRGSELEENLVAPRTPIEEVLAEIWVEVLRIERVGISDNFLELGGHSLLAIQVISQVRDALGLELPLRCLFEAPTVAELAQYVETLQKHCSKFLIPPIQPVAQIENLPLSFGQEQLWILHQLAPDTPVYNEPSTIRLAGNVNVAALEKALNEIVLRHEILRTTYKMVDGQPMQEIAPSLTVPIPVVDLRSLTTSEREAEALRLATLEARQPFDLASGPVLRATLMRLDETDCRLFLTAHHIVNDGISSYSVFLPELQNLYQAFCADEPSPLKELPIQYADFAVWQRQWLQSEVLEPQIAYWKQQLADVPVLQLPTDRPRTARQSFRGSRQCLALSRNLTDELLALSRREGVTLFMTLLAAFKTLLYRYTGVDDIPVGTVTGSRNRPELEGSIGFFLNTLVLRTDLSGDPSFQQLLERVREVTLEADAHRDLPFEHLVQTLLPERSSSRNPLFQVSFVLEPPMPALDSGWNMSQLDVDTGTAKFDLTLELDERPEGIVGRIEYSTDLFEGSTISRMIGHYQALLEGIVANPIARISDLPLLTPPERHQLLVEWNNTWAEYPQDKCIHQLFEKQVECTPDAVAVVFEEEQLTYLELNAKANQLALYLRSLGVGPEVLVGICVERSLDAIVGILGILKAGGAYVPIDPAYPVERIAYMLDDSQLPVLLTQKQLVASLPEHQARVVCLDADWEKISAESELPPQSDVTPENLAYVIYTSGSTGKPKGVLIAHQGLRNLAQAQIKLFDVQPDSRVLQFASLSFDASISEIVMALCSGAQLCLGTRESLQPGQPLVRLLQQQSITHLTLVPSALAALPNEELPALQNIIVAGEPCPTSLVAQWAAGRRFFNAYGPTESTVCATVTQGFEGMDVLPIGRPIDNTQVYILDRHKQPVPIGVPGELHIAGVGLAKGYLNRPELTQEKFIPNPFSNEPGSRLYKTGDLARYLPDGNIEFLGRIDNQVKIRGFRIELGEIEAVLAKHPNVRSVTVIDREDTPGNKRLVAYLVSNLIPDRIPYHSECQLELNGNAITIHTQDISTGGVGLVGVPAIERGESVRVRMQLPGESEPRWLSGTVVWSRPPQAGIRFHLTPSEQAQIDQSVDYQLNNQDLWKTLQRTVTRNLRDYLKQKLPDYMIPSAFVLVKALPLTPNGKIDRRALAAPDNFHNEQEDKFVAPRTPSEAKLAAMWAEVLGVQQVGINDNFFELGGHSLLATQIISRIRQAFAIELPLRHLFEAPTIASLGKIIEPRLHPVSQEKSSDSAVSNSLPDFVPVPRETYIPLSFSQEAIWSAQQLYPDSSAYNSPIALRFTRTLCPEALEKSINEIIRRHEILRTTFPLVDGQPVQAIANKLALPLVIVDLQGIPLAQREAEAQRLYAVEVQYKFDLTSSPLIKTTLLHLTPQEHWLLITMHHIITDGWSHHIFLQELDTLYNAFLNGLPSPLPEVRLQYADFTLWHRKRFNEEVLQKQLSYWVEKLTDSPQPLENAPAETVCNSTNSKQASFYSVVLPAHFVASILALSRSQGITPFAIIITALNILLFKWSGQTEILILATIGNRTMPETEKMLGCFINAIILRSHLFNDETGIELLKRVQKTANEAINNNDISLYKVLKTIRRFRKVTLSAGITMEVPENAHSSGWEMLSEPPIQELFDADIPLDFSVSLPTKNSNFIYLGATFSTELFAEETIKKLFSYCQYILQKLIESPDMKIGNF